MGAATTLSGNLIVASVVDVSWTPSEVNTIVAPVQTITVPGARVGDVVIVTPPGQTAGVTIGSARVSAANTVAVQFVNPTAGALTPAAGVHKFTILRHEGLAGAPRVTT